MRPIALLLLLVTAACGEGEARTADDADDPCSPKEDVKHAGQTAGSAAKAGAQTAAEGVKTFGESVGGFFEGGSSEAKKEWKEGSERTREAAREGGADTKSTAKSRPCP